MRDKKIMNLIKIILCGVGRNFIAGTAMQSPAVRSADLMMCRERPKRVQLPYSAFKVNE